MVSAPPSGTGTNLSNSIHGPSGARIYLNTNASHATFQHNKPLSALRAPPLDLASVERRGYPSMAKETLKRNRLFGLEEAPTYRPTEEEFKEPFTYIKKIAPEASKYGICKIIPPDNWNPPFAIDTERFHFRTRKQELNSVEGGNRTNLNYLDQLQKFHKLQGNNLNRFPSVDKRPLDMFKLKKAVEVRGGFDKVCKLKKWAEIGRDLGYSGKIMSSLSTSLKNSYQRWLQPYEEYLRLAKPGVHQQLELENLSNSYSPPVDSPLHPSQDTSPTPGNSSTRNASPSIVSSTSLNYSSKDHGDTKDGFDASPPPPPPPIERAPSPPLEPLGFTAINASSSFIAINTMPPQAKYEDDSGIATPSFTGTNSMNNTPDYSVTSAPLAQAQNGHQGKGIKRAISHETLSMSPADVGTPNLDVDGSNGRRSKRLKKEPAPTVSGSHTSQMRPSTLHGALGDIANRKKGAAEKCEGCNKSGDVTNLIACDSCDSSYHRYCLEPPLLNTPEHGWHCPKCLVGTGEFGFEEGGTYSLKSFQDKAREFKDEYFEPKMPFDPILNRNRPVTEDDVEREFWKLVESLTETIEVEYGADIHSTTHGSGFPVLELNPLDPYSVDPWNLNILPFHNESLFRHIKTDISGMTVPWLYVGMCFSTFCWHSEDHYTYSANYQHFGATKTWYGIPGSDADNFEKAMKDAVPELFETQPDLLFQLVTLLPPDQLKKAGVNVYALDQRAGQFVLTFPRAYHAGFNHGFNFNEAVNFAPPDWEPYGEAGVKRLQEFRRTPCFSHDELLLTAAARDTTIKSAKWLAPALQRLKAREFAERVDFIQRHKDAAADHGHCMLDPHSPASDVACEFGFAVDEEDNPDVEYQCAFCNAYAYLSRFECHKSKKVLCLAHAGDYECCHCTRQERLTNNQHSLHYRLNDDALAGMIQKVVDKAHLPEAWEEKLNKVLEDNSAPPLKALRSLLTEGEKIPYPLQGLSDLRIFVEQCNEWVDEATNYVTRKQQNRRKNEKAWRKVSAKAAELEERDRELRKFENIKKLLRRADELSFDCPEIVSLRERAKTIDDFVQKACAAMDESSDLLTRIRFAGAEIDPNIISKFEELAEQGKGFTVDIPEVDLIEGIIKHLKWMEEAHERRSCYQTLEDVGKMVDKGKRIGIEANNEHMRFFFDQQFRGEMWETKVKEIMKPEMVNYQQLEALATQASTLPVSPETRAKVDAILSKQREAHKHIVALYQRSKDPNLRKRPKYKEVRDLMESLQSFNSKPAGTIDLEKEQKRHEDWMRRGKKLFGKANAPLHILLMHMQYVESHNRFALDLEDRPRSPVEPASREATPEEGTEKLLSRRDVFCICRQPEAGMMIECELCHEWYHGKCLKIARGKVKETDKFTCPICDWRVKIPRDAARPKLEDLQDWQAEIPDLPFQPDEEDTLANIIDVAQTFRDHMRPYVNPLMASADEVPTMLFWLRKIEGAEILLAYEYNFFRQELHKWAPVASEPPPLQEYSLSTRKPRPTKQQRIMAELGVDKPEDLPPQYQSRTHLKRKTSDAHQKLPHPLQPALHSLSHTISPSSSTLLSHSHQSTGGAFGYPEPGFTSGSPRAGSTSSYLSGHHGLTPPLPPSPGLVRSSLLFDTPYHPSGSNSELHWGSANNSPKDHILSDFDRKRDCQSQNVDALFADLTNQDDTTDEPIENSHASEALEAVNGANNSEIRTDDGHHVFNS